MVAFVATALAADRVATSAPALRPTQMAVAARRLTGRLVVSLRRVVAAAPMRPSRRDEQPAHVALVPALVTNQAIHPFEFSPFQFRLPPPLL